jgi:hypothetical protein
MNYFADIDLMKMNGAEIIDHETIGGGIVRGVFIPLEENGLRYYPNRNVLHYYMDISECRPNPDGFTHNIKPYIRKADREAFIERYGRYYIGKMKLKMSENKKMFQPDVDEILGLRQVDTSDPKYSVYRKLTSAQVAQKKQERAERKARREARRAERERRRQEKLKQQEKWTGKRITKEFTTRFCMARLDV